ncbi:alpha/beta hydrolase [Luteolibacter sp. GHJ8]|uniref:Alpha/beta hydrolase n=1 Tax=Luteolibacter rhizosphaerae TaxID=2989719 RepID=A0ABT3G5Y1_9BACT|nr:alpha/beta hydrolase [Luteolibacter rhizosphaerae]MCW1915062.1 alpha/beta hydrolase [Luteolibacter rhizosphaerae]
MLRILSIGVALIGLAEAEPLKVEGLPIPVELSLPANHDPGKSYPAVFYYHGSNGRPTTKVFREHAGPNDWIVVGMTYTKPGPFTYTPENLQREIAVLHRVRDQLAQTKGLDPKRVYVSGFSMGGWMSGMFLQADPSLAGAVILGAGHMSEIKPKAVPLKPGTPLFIGVGRKDGTYPFALKARLFFGKLGAEVRMETWNDLGHDFPKTGSPALKEWFALRNGGTRDEKALQAEYAKIGALPPLQQWRGLLEFRERPYVNVAGQKWPETLKVKIAELEQMPEVAEEAKAFKRHRQLLADEVNAVTLEDLQTVQAGYETLVLQAGNGEEVKLIQEDLKRLSGLLENFEGQRAAREQTKPQEVPQPPRGDRQIPKNPMVR